MLGRLCIITFVLVTLDLSLAGTRPPTTRSFSVFHNSSSVYIASITTPSTNLIQPQLFQLGKDSYAVVDFEPPLFFVTTLKANWTQIQTFTYSFPSSQGNAGSGHQAISGPDGSVIVTAFLANVDILQSALLINDQGQVLFNSSIHKYNSGSAPYRAGCRINEDYFAIGSAAFLLVYNNSFNIVYSHVYNTSKALNMDCDGTHLYIAVQFSDNGTSIMKFHPSDWTNAVAVHNTSKLPVSTTMSVAVVGNILMVTVPDSVLMNVMQLRTDTLAELGFSSFTDPTTDGIARRSPSYTHDGYLMYPSKNSGAWVESPMNVGNGQMQAQSLPSNLWKASYALDRRTRDARFVQDIYGNGYIGVMKDMNITSANTSLTEIRIMLFGDVCGDFKVSGAGEECDGGEFCTIKCQCQSGYKPTSPMSNDCELDTSFNGCASCSGDASQCDEARGACVGHRVAPIFQCVEERTFGLRRAYFSYRSNQTMSITSGSSNNIITPHGIPSSNFSLGRPDVYPLYSFYVDYVPATTTVEWYLDGTSLTFDVSNSSLQCPSTINLLVDATPAESEMASFPDTLKNALGQIMNIRIAAISVSVQSNKKRQTVTTYKVSVTDDTLNSRTAADAIRTLFNNVTVLYQQVNEVQSIDIVPLANELGETLPPTQPPSTPISSSTPNTPSNTSPAAPISPSTPLDAPISGGQPPVDSSEPSSATNPESNRPTSATTGNGPTSDNITSGWSNNYIAAIILVPAAVGAAIFLAVYFSRKKKKQRTGHKSSLLDNSPSNTTFSMPLSELRKDDPNYTEVPDASPNTTASDKYGAITSISKVNTTDRLSVPYADLKFKKEIGAGAYGKVFIGEWQRIQVALKINTSATGDDFAREARLMVELRPHPNVVQMLGVSSDGPYPVMILEFCDGGSLDDKLFNMNQVITPQQQLEIVLGIAKGLYHLHKNQIVHRDLAARNILLNHNTPKISDFGLSRQVGEEQKGTTKSTVGPIRWMAPESLKKMAYSSKSDVWTFGIVVYEIIARHEPHSEADQMAIGLEIRDHGATPTIPSECDPVLKEIMNQCWQMDPEERPTMEQICDILDRYMEEKH